MTTGGFGGEEIKRESSWRYSLSIFFVTLFLCAVFLYYYFGPSVDEIGGNVPSPAISEEQISLAVADREFRIPANYTVFPRDRRGGQRTEIFLYALWPTLAGYTPARRDEFIENAEDTRRIDIAIVERTSFFDEQGRIENLFMPATVDRRGARTPFQLVKYEFREQLSDVPTNGYSDTELYIGEDADGKVAAIFCFIEYEYGDRVSVTWRIKRPYLAEWRKIDEDVRAFVNNLEAQ